MTWAAPAALAGLGLLALPVLIHLMGAGRATVRRFPSLRFIPGTRLPPVRRRRIHDVPLLLLRLLALAAATLAVARPLTRGAATPAALVSRVIIVDSAIVAGTARDAARRAADSLRGGADVSMVVATREPAALIPGAVAWLAGQPGRRELVVVSDFRLDGLDSTDLAQVPEAIGVRLVRPPGAGDAGGARGDPGAAVVGIAGGRRVVVRASVAPGRTDVNWTAGARETRGVPLVFAAGANDSVAIVPRGAVPGAVAGGALAAPRTPAEGELAAPRRPAEGDLIAALHLDGEVLREASGFRAGVVRVGDRDRVTVLSPGGAASAATAALAIRAAGDAGPDAAPAMRDPAVRPDAELAAWERPAPAGSSPVTSDDSPVIVRSLWALALLALAAEFLLRRRLERRPAPGMVDHGQR
ncbi:MAG: BatA domain-containing protein [Gemmatimonadota bacterium]|nr:BatA domain-containing protein [Gemmatimonadota bacterium]